MFVFVLRREWNEWFPVLAELTVSPDHLTSRQSSSFAICILALITAAGKIYLRLYLPLQRPYKGHKYLSYKGANVPLLFFVQFYRKTTQKLEHNDEKSPLQFRWFQYGFVIILRHVYARIGRKRLFSFWSDRLFHFSF